MRLLSLASFLSLILTSGESLADGLLPQESAASLCYSLESPMTLPQLVDIALNNNPQTRVAWGHVRQAMAQVKVAESSYYPKIAASGRAQQRRDYIFLVGPQKTFSEVDAGVALSYLLFDWGERSAAVDAARCALLAANWWSDWKMQEVMFRVVERSYECWKAMELLEAQLQTQHDARVIVEATEELHRVGLKTNTDVYAAKTALAEIDMLIIHQKATLDIANGALAVSIGLVPDQNRKIYLTNLADPSPFLISNQELAQLMAMASQTRADIQAKRAEICSLEANALRVSKGCKPKVRAEAATGWQHYFHDHANGYNYFLGIGVEVPIFDGFYVLNKTREACAQVETSQAEMELLQHSIALDVLAAGRHVDAAQQALKLSQERLEYATKTYEGALERYTVGTYGIYELIDAQQRLAGSRIQHSDTKFRWYLSAASLAYMTGTLGSLSEESCYLTHAN